MKLLVINGPNINLLGTREREIYGEKSYRSLVRFIKTAAAGSGIRVKCRQFNCEGSIINQIQRAAERFNGIVINAAAYAHTSIAVLDALKAANLPTVEVHLTDTSKREEYRRFSYISEYALKVIEGQGFDGYSAALEVLSKHLQNTAQGV